MKKTVRSLIAFSLVAGSLMLYSCREQSEKEEEMAPEHQMHSGEDMSDEGEKSSSLQDSDAKFKDEKTQQVFKNYLALKDALVKTDAEAAKTAAIDLNSVIEEENEISVIASKIAGTTDINKQRELFSELTAAMEPVLKDAISSGKIYKQFCPMAFEGKGDYWYSNSEEIRNPYYGDKMLKCGRVEETIM